MLSALPRRPSLGASLNTPLLNAAHSPLCRRECRGPLPRLGTSRAWNPVSRDWLTCDLSLILFLRAAQGAADPVFPTTPLRPCIPREGVAFCLRAIRGHVTAAVCVSPRGWSCTEDSWPWPCSTRSAREQWTYGGVGSLGNPKSVLRKVPHGGGFNHHAPRWLVVVSLRLVTCPSWWLLAKACCGQLS